MYNYLKIVIKHLKPEDHQQADIIKSFRNISQQSFAFTRELNTNLLKNKDDLKEIIPAMKINPFKNIGIQQENPYPIDHNRPHKVEKLTGMDLLINSIYERRRIIDKKKRDDSQNKDFYKF
jgi:hypothetical protein